ncbi:phage antirepressor Ant [Bifidobacterium tissieri]|uniref:Phage antirepressor Ant n=1 Tax=Bifidobacterium tissieri TaxID=1630162 RepID=A0A5M9ZVD3_9BIFI|nr:BRO family protein [Bifidobacterium tissieri]KAA8831439.1 phage antirepressor Ant [Bifidobacterium tissieri]
MPKTLTMVSESFDFHGRQLRSLTDEQGAPWFIAKDACTILGTDTRDVRKVLDPDEVTNVDTIHIAQNGGKSPLIISEPGLYKLILRSRKPEAKEFQRWVSHEVLPAIRRTGTYAIQPADDDMTVLAKAQLIAQNRLEQQGRLIAAQRDELDRQRPLALMGEAFVNTDGTMSVSQAARHFQTIDRRMTRDAVYGILRGGGYVEVRSNAPTKKAVQPGYLKPITPIKANGKTGRQYARFTAKGVRWFIDRYIYGTQQGRLEGVA